jgi:hypothetical protein
VMHDEIMKSKIFIDTLNIESEELFG